MNAADVSVQNEGNVLLFHLWSAQAQAWVADNVADDAVWFGSALVVDHRYAGDLAGGMSADGLTLC